MMYKTMNYKQLVSMALIALLLTFLGACASGPMHTGERPESLAHIKLERVGSTIAEIKHAYLSLVDDELVLRGEVQRKLHKRGSVPGHLHVQVLDNQGEVLDDEIVCTTMKCRKTGTAKFIYRTEILPDRISKIRIVHHESHSHS